MTLFNDGFHNLYLNIVLSSSFRKRKIITKFLNEYFSKNSSIRFDVELNCIYHPVSHKLSKRKQPNTEYSVEKSTDKTLKNI